MLGSACRGSRGRRAASRAATRARAGGPRPPRRPQARRPCRRSAPAGSRARRAPRRSGPEIATRARRRLPAFGAAQQRDGAVPVARRAGQVDAAATSATVGSERERERASAARPPGGSSLSVTSRSDVGPEASSAPVPSPSAAAGTAMRQARSACAATIVARGKPSERWMPIVASRRWTSAWAATPSITPCGAEHDDRERDEQRQHDPRRLVEQHADALASDEAQVLSIAERRRARLLQRHVHAPRGRASRASPC